MIRQVFLVACALAVLVLIVQLAGPWRVFEPSTAPSVNAQRPPRAFTATRSDAIFRAGESVPFRSKFETIAVRSDGSRVEMEHLKDPSGTGKILFMKKIIDVPRTRWVVVDPLSASVLTYPLREEGARFHAVKPLAECEGQPAGKLLNYDISMGDTTRELPRVGEAKIRAWLAPALNCFPLRREIRILIEGEEKQVTVESVVALIEGEPEAWLFEVPAGYVERTPSEALAEAKRRYPNWQELGTPTSQPRLDQVYVHHQREHVRPN